MLNKANHCLPHDTTASRIKLAARASHLRQTEPAIRLVGSIPSHLAHLLAHRCANPGHDRG